ncbi:MAG: peptidoglycan bridge formation glycyltransferase FemA/FemB family protein [Candidatus Falkowbacteria bacterium]|nr:peptidoglycan bridge formation glycyltransferase FemA/FemB family protein [Candidatus Falkowbacteria bacterium]
MSIAANKNYTFLQTKDILTLNKFVVNNKHNAFLQSVEWSEFQKQAGNEVYCFGLKNQAKVLVLGTFILKDLPMGKKYLYSPKGPIINQALKITHSDWQEIVSIFFDKVKKQFSPKLIFIRIESDFLIELNKNDSSLQKTIDIQPSQTMVLNLEQSEEQLLKGMHQKTRYNIRLAEKKAIKVVESNLQNIDEFWRLMHETKERDNFRLHNKRYYEDMIRLLGNKNDKDRMQVKLFLAEYDSKFIATGLFSFFGDTVTYLHGASSNEFRNVMAPYLLQWDVIKQSKLLGYKYYDFYGIDEKKWPGVTRFKQGFGGEIIKNLGTFDLIINRSWYKLYKTVRALRRK